MDRLTKLPFLGKIFKAARFAGMEGDEEMGYFHIGPQLKETSLWYQVLTVLTFPFTLGLGVFGAFWYLEWAWPIHANYSYIEELLSALDWVVVPFVVIFLTVGVVPFFLRKLLGLHTYYLDQKERVVKARNGYTVFSVDEITTIERIHLGTKVSTQNKDYLFAPSAHKKLDNVVSQSPAILNS